MTKHLPLLLAAAAALSAVTAAAAPKSLKNPLYVVKSCQSLEAQKTEKCQRAEDYCSRKTGDPACMRYNSLKKKYPFEKQPEQTEPAAPAADDTPAAASDVQ